MNLPNKISVGRIIAMFIAIILATIGDINETSTSTTVYWLHLAAFIIAFVAGFSDIIDGWIARKYNLVTDFGMLMDPLADKVYLSISYILMVKAGLIPALIAIIIICREFMVTGLRTLVVQKGTVMAADGLGKVKSIVQVLVAGVAGAAWVQIGGLTLDILNVYHIWDTVLWVTAALTVWSGVKYFIEYRSLYLDDM